MKIIILEGISTSGKTTIKNSLIKYFDENNKSFLIVDESETLMPILNNTNCDVAKSYLLKIVSKYFEKDIDFLIFDRFYFTHIYRTNSLIKDFNKIELLFKERNSKIIFFKIDEDLIIDRIFNSMEFREKSWSDYVNKKGDRNQINNYYTNQQRILLKYLDESKINFEIYNTSNFDFENIFNKIIKNI